MVTFPAALPKIPYGGFSPVRLQAPGTCTVQQRVSPARPGVKSDPNMPHRPSRLARAFGTASTAKQVRLNVRSRGSDRPTWAQRPSLRRGYHVPALDAYRPHPPVWSPPTHFPATPVIGSVFGIPGSSCLGSRPSELSLPGFPRLPPSTSAGSSVRAFPHSYRTDTGHRLEGRKSWHSNIPLESASCGTRISTVSPFALAAALSVARPLS